jgi:hypothetical protein
MDALILSLPSHHSTVRMRIWRALKENGWAALRDGVYIRPPSRDNVAAAHGIEAAVRGAGGSAMAVELKFRSGAELAQARALFDRTADYAALVHELKAATAALPRLGARKARTAIDRLARAAEKIGAIDFFPGPAKEQALRVLAELEEAFQASYGAGEPRASRRRVRRLPRERYQKRVWATRQHPWVDRLASAWLIRRFIDREPRFLWLESPRARPKNAIGFDYDGAQFTHTDGRVTFEVLVASFGLDADPALKTLGAAVHFLDAGGIPVPEAHGLETMLKGARERAKDDDALLAEAMRIFDLLYRGYGASVARS